MRILVALLAVTFGLTGCLKTRNEVREGEQRQVMAQQVTTLQKTNADTGSRFQEVEEMMRDLNGRVDVVENKLERSAAGADGNLKASQAHNAEMNSKVNLLQEALTKMEGQLFQLTAEVQALKADKAAAVATAQAQQAQATATKAKKDSYEVAKEYFDKKDWKQAILNFQKYRDDNPKGGKIPEPPS